MPLLGVPELLVLLSVLVPVFELLLVPVEPASARRLVPEFPPSSLEPMLEHAPTAVKAKATAVAITFLVCIWHLIEYVIELLATITAAAESSNSKSSVTRWNWETKCRTVA